MTTRSRRFSQAISEGDGISVIVPVGDLDAARIAEQERAEGIVVRGAVEGLRDVTSLPILWRDDGPLEDAQRCGADACLVVVADLDDEGDSLERVQRRAEELGLECVFEVRKDEELELALERVDPEIFLLSPGDDADGPAALEHVLELLPDVPAGKLAIADLQVTARSDVEELERAGIDAVIVTAGNVRELVGTALPEV